MNESPYRVLDARQIKRIEAVHGGFLYQHLYAVGCLFLAAKAGASEVVVERDEDIEIATGAQRVYVQVKTRSAPIMPSDIDDVLRRFSQLRREHAEGQREGGARFVIIVNSAPSPALGAQIQSNGIPDDVSIHWPGHTMAHAPAVLPPAWSGVPEAVQWCIAAAETLPFALLTPESLVWKLAGRVLLAGSGGGQTSITRSAWKVFQRCSSNC